MAERQIKEVERGVARPSFQANFVGMLVLNREF
jgi:hypothetical protein